MQNSHITIMLRSAFVNFVTATAVNFTPLRFRLTESALAQASKEIRSGGPLRGGALRGGALRSGPLRSGPLRGGALRGVPRAGGAGRGAPLRRLRLGGPGELGRDDILPDWGTCGWQSNILLNCLILPQHQSRWSQYGPSGRTFYKVLQTRPQILCSWF